MQERREQFGQLQGEIWRLFEFGMLLMLIAEGFLILPPKPQPVAAEKTRRSAVAPPALASR